MTLIGAVEAGGTKFVLALARPGGEVLERTRLDTRHPDATMAAMAAWFSAAQSRHGRIAAFGVASFGPLDLDPASPGWGSLTTTPKPGWSGASFPAALARFGVPLAVDTDVNGAALGEWQAGAGQDCATLAYTTVGTGIGTGVVRHGRALGGISHYEAGHIRPARPVGDDWRGHCPYHGACLEGLASGPAIIARWGHDLSQARPDQLALVAGYLAEFAATLALLHMPERMIFGGGVMQTPGLLEAVREQTRARLAGYVTAYDKDLAQVIVSPGLGDLAGITGAMALGQQALAGKI